MDSLKSRLGKRTVYVLEKYFTGESIDYRQIIAIITPLLVDQAFIILMSLLNTAMISSSGVAAVSAVSMVDSLNIFLVNVFIAIATGGTVIVAQYRGNGNHKMVTRAASQAISAVAVISIAISVIVIIFHQPTLKLLFGNAEEEVLHNAKIYLIGSCISYPFIAIFQAILGALRGVAETKPCLGLSLMMNITYLLLNILFITILDMGVMGLVISLNLSRLLGMVTSIYYLLKINHSLRYRLKRAFTFDVSIVKKIMFIGIPFAAEQMFFNGGKLLTQTFIVQLGTLALTVNAIGSSIAMLFQIGGNALSLAIVTVVGQCIGAGHIQDARKFVRSFLLCSSLFFVAISLLIFPLFPFIVQLFSPPEEIISTLFVIMLMTGLAQPFLWSISFIMPSALRAAGDSKFTSIASLLTMWLFRVVLGYLLGIVWGYGIIGVWIAMIAEWGVRSVVFYCRFRGDKWLKHKLV